jgi:hypothetical protein
LECVKINTVAQKQMELTQEEWNELVALKDAINYDPSQVHYEKMERFTELFVKTLEGKGDNCPM